MIATASRGEVVFAQYCNSCHPKGGRGSGPSLVQAGISKDDGVVPIERLTRLHRARGGEQVRLTVIHELGHYFGLDEDQLRSVQEDACVESTQARSYASADDPNLVLDTVKRAEGSDAVVLRLYEAHGGRGVEVKLRLAALTPLAQRLAHGPTRAHAVSNPPHTDANGPTATFEPISTRSANRIDDSGEIHAWGETPSSVLLAMDIGHLEIMKRNCPDEYRAKVRLFMSYARRFKADEVPDPYYGKADGFEAVMRLCEAGAQGLMARLDTEPGGDGHVWPGASKSR